MLKKITLFGAALLGAVALFGFVVQQRKDAAVLTTHPAPGSFVEVDGHRIHFRTGGEGDFTFVLEAGLGNYSGNWATLDSSLARIGRVFVYDRAGLGWSEEGPTPRTAQQITTELHRALEQAQVRKPFILVGHSLGGLTQTLYAMRYPEDVAGLLLIDPSHPDQFKKLPGLPAVFTFLMTQVSRTALLGLPQFLMHSSDPIATHTKHVRTGGAELRAFLNIADTWGDRSIALGPTPIYVLTGGDYSRFPGESEAEKKAVWEGWRSLHEALVAASSSGIRKHEIVDGASHYVHQTHAAAVIDAAREMVDRIKARPMPPG